MPNPPRDPTLDTLLALNGTLMSITESGDWWVKFVVRRVPVTAEKPHGLDYSLTLHGPGNARYVGYDNAHSITVGSGPGAWKPVAQDHRHRMKSVKPYEYHDAATLLADFWQEVDAVLKEEGAAP